jgi:chromosome segregation ATPase
VSAENEIAAVIADLRRHWPTQVEISVAADLLESLQSLLAKKDERLSQARALEAKLQGEINEHELEIAELRARCEAAENEREALKEYVIGKGWSLATVLANISAANRHKHCELIPKGAAIDAQRKEEGL